MTLVDAVTTIVRKKLVNPAVDLTACSAAVVNATFTTDRTCFDPARLTLTTVVEVETTCVTNRLRCLLTLVAIVPAKATVRFQIILLFRATVVASESATVTACLRERLSVTLVALVSAIVRRIALLRLRATAVDSTSAIVRL